MGMATSPPRRLRIQPSDTVTDDSDCDDDDIDINPAATEVCDDVDNKDSLIDDDDPALDVDTVHVLRRRRRGRVRELRSVLPPVASRPGTPTMTPTVMTPSTPSTLEEICDGIDNDCGTDVDIDDSDFDPAGIFTYYLDDDSDGYGDSAVTVTDCDAPTGYVDIADDCDDTDDTINPDAPEVCDSIDNDCDGDIDDDDSSLNTTSATSYFTDADLDGYGDPDTETLACVQPSGTSPTTPTATTTTSSRTSQPKCATTSTTTATS